MGSRRRGIREGIPNVNYEREQETFMATMNNVAEVVREAAVAAARAVERLGVRMETRMNTEKIMGMMRTT